MKTLMINSTAPPSINMDLEIRFMLYSVCGVFVLLSSGATILVFNTNREFRTKYTFFNGLAIADFINGLSFVIAGIFRSRYMHEGIYFLPVTNAQCIWETPWAVLMIVAGQLPAFLNLCLSLERVIALEYSSWYRRVWKEYYNHYLVVGCFILTLMSLSFVMVLDQIHVVISPNRICAVMNSTGIIYGTVHYSLCALIFFACFVILLVIFRKTNRNKKPTSSEKRRQSLLQWITGISVVLVSIPNLILILNEWKLPEFNALIVGIAYCLYALHSSMSLPIYLYFRKDFRKWFYYLLLRREISGGDSSLAKGSAPSITITGVKGTPKRQIPTVA